MFHERRIWTQPQRVESECELAHKLTQMTWCLCDAFEYAGYLYLNDATHEDGALEYAVVKRVSEGFIQVESITFSWCTLDQALGYIKNVTQGKYDSEAWPVKPQFDDSNEHMCHHCR